MTFDFPPAMTIPPTSSHQKKRVGRAKKPAKMGSPEAPMPLPVDDASGSDSEAEYHDALGEGHMGMVCGRAVGINCGRL